MPPRVNLFLSRVHRAMKLKATFYHARVESIKQVDSHEVLRPKSQPRMGLITS